MPFSRLGPSTRLPSSSTSPVVGRLEPAHHAHHRRLAAARGADEDDELALGDGERQRVDHRDRRAAAVRERLGQLAELR